MILKKNLSLLIILFLCTFFFLHTPLIQAYEDDTSIVYLYFSWINDDGAWNDWVNVSDQEFSDVNLNVGQAVKCRLHIKCKIKGILLFCIREPGSKTYDVIEGSRQDQYIQCLIASPGDPASADSEDYYIFTPNELIEYDWVLLPNDAWMGARAPINCYWEVKPKPTQQDDQGDWIQPASIIEEHTLAYPYLMIANWTGATYQPKPSTAPHGNSTADSPYEPIDSPGFELIVLPLALSFIVFYTYKKKKKQ